MRYLVNPTTGELKEENAAVSLDIIAPEEETAVASRAYAEGEQFILGGKLYAATAAIASGASIVTEGAGANAEEAPNVINQIENHTPAVMTGATANTDGTAGLAPQPHAGDEDKVLQGKGVWGKKLEFDTVIRNGKYGYINANNEFVSFNSQSDLSDVSGTLSIDHGGTGATTAAAARTNLGLATVASSGSYNDLSNKPTIPAKTSQLTNDSGFITQDTTKLPLSGGTMTGSITMSGTTYISYANLGTTTRNLIYATMGDNDQFRLAAGATAANAGWAEIATADDGNEPIYVRQYSGAFTTVKRTLTLLDGSGNTSIPGSLTIDSHLTLGGIFIQGVASSVSAAASYAQGRRVHASGYYSHAEGEDSRASGDCSHAEGDGTSASGYASHAEGNGTCASGDCSHAEGLNTTTSGKESNAKGGYTSAAGPRQLVCGTYNKAYTSSSGTSGGILIVGKGSNGALANCFRVTTANIYATAAYSSSGADYAEMFEWEDGNPDKEDRAGLFVAISDDKIKIANSSDDFILGIVSGNPSCVGDVYDDQWNGMFETDIFGRSVYETYFDEDTLKYETREKLNPNYDPSQEYIARSARPEWDAVGLVGKLIAIDDGTAVVNGWVKPNDAGIATASVTLTKFRVIKRLDESHIQVLIL